MINKIIKFKLFKDEHYCEQKEKHAAYLQDGFRLTNQKQDKDGLIIRTYTKEISELNNYGKFISG